MSWSEYQQETSTISHVSPVRIILPEVPVYARASVPCICYSIYSALPPACLLKLSIGSQNEMKECAHHLYEQRRTSLSLTATSRSSSIFIN